MKKRPITWNSKAARLRDQINAIRKISKGKCTQSPKSGINRIIVGKDSLASVFGIRSGKIMAKDTFHNVPGQDEGELLAQFLRRYYTDNEDIPKELMVSTLPAEQELIEEYRTVLPATK